MKSVITAVFLIQFLFTFSQVTQEWVKRFDGSASLNDVAISIDADGFVYVAGHTLGSGTSFDWKIIKYDPAGNERWSRTYNGAVNGSDFVSALVLDAAGNVYVTGSVAASGGSDFATLKLDTAGNILWTAVYDGSAAAPDRAVDLKVDAAGNAYITGESAGAGGPVDIVTLKYSAAGVLLWDMRYAGPANNDDIPAEITLDNDGNAIVTGSTFTAGGNFDAITLKYSPSGILSWSATFNGGANLDDAAHAVTTDNVGNIYITGATGVTALASNFLTIKYTPQGNQAWAGFYNGPANDDDQASDIVFSKGAIYVTGGSKGTSASVVTYDFATIKYGTNGAVKWLQRYNGTGNGVDFANAIIADESGDVVVTGTSYSGTITNEDYLTIRYSKQGDLEWLQTYNNAPVNGSDRAIAVTMDDLGNVYVTGISFGSGTFFDFATVKYSQTNKLVQGLRSKLELLMVGLLNESTNDTIKTIVNESCSRGVDSVYFIRFDTLIAVASRQGIDLKARMNAAIASYYSIDPEEDHVGRALKTLRIRGNKMTALIVIPMFHRFSGAQLMNDPKLVYGFEEEDYPVKCLNCPSGQLTRDEAETTLAWGGVINIPPWTYERGWVHIRNCVAQLDASLSNRCQVCPQNTPLDGILIGTGPNLMNHELEINLGTNGVVGSDACYNPPAVSVGPNPPPMDNYAKLSKIAGTTYWKASPGVDYRTIQKVLRPLTDRNYDPLFFTQPTEELSGDVLTICESDLEMNVIGEPGRRFSLAYGIYRIERPLINQQPLFFAFPYARGLWFSQGPDMRLFYGTDFTSSNCPSGPMEILQEYETRGCSFCNQANVFNINTSDVTKYIATTDFNFLYNYWNDNVISIGFRTGGSNVALSSNVIHFNAVSAPTPCLPPATPLKVQMVVLPSNDFEIINTFINNVAYPPGTALTIHVRAMFSNGESIDECQNLVLAPNTNDYTHVSVQIRGNINNYSSSLISYQIDVY